MACSCCENQFDDLTQYISGVFDPEHPQSSLISILHHAQERYGYLSKDVIEHIAQVTEVPAAEIYGVVTFYSLFKTKPQGKHRISVCMGTACYIRGGAKILEALEDMLDIKPGETTEDMLFTLSETRCIGACGLAPIMTVDDKVYGRVEPEQVKGIIAEWREKAEKV
ncbi:MAG: NADH-quinone oxidoreductase subunit NuoE [Armatimonadota bacterium]|nr:NADH-quinone oxidoreductase subunit NuoE [bacterium]